MADIIASKLPYKCDFDIIIPRKLTAPHNKEIAIGAFVTGGLVIVTSSMVKSASAGLTMN